MVETDANVHMFVCANMRLFDHQDGPKTDYRYDSIDLDPFGSSIEFLDNALLAVKDGGS